MRTYVMEVGKHYGLNNTQGPNGVTNDFSRCLAHVRSYVKEANVFLVDIIDGTSGTLVKPNILYSDDGTPFHTGDYMPDIKVKTAVAFLNKNNVSELISSIRALLNELEALHAQK